MDNKRKTIPDDEFLVELPSHSFAVLHILEYSFVNYIMSHPLLHSVISSWSVIAGFNYGLRDINLPCICLRAPARNCSPGVILRRRIVSVL